MVWEVVAVIALVFMALIFLPRFLKSGIATLPEFLDIRFGSSTQLICNLLFLIAYMVQLLPIILYTGAVGMGGILDVQRITGIESPTVVLWTLIWLIGIIGSIYALFGGMRSIVISDLLNGIGLLTGGIMITLFGLWACGAVDLSAAATAEAAPASGSIVRGLSNLGADVSDHLNSIGASDSQAPFLQIFTGIILINMFYWCTNQQIIQRALAASSLKEGQKGVLLTGLLKLIGPLYLVLPGIMAFFLFRHGALDVAGGAVDAAGELIPDHAYGSLVRTVLPALFQVRFECPDQRRVFVISFHRLHDRLHFHKRSDIQPAEVQSAALFCLAGWLSRLCPSRPSPWRVCRSRGTHRPAAPAQTACTGWTGPLLPSSSPRRPRRRTTWS